jgi:hypothetical protein
MTGIKKTLAYCITELITAVIRFTIQVMEVLLKAEKIKGGSITLPLASCLTGLD